MTIAATACHTLSPKMTASTPMNTVANSRLGDVHVHSSWIGLPCRSFSGISSIPPGSTATEAVAVVALTEFEGRFLAGHGHAVALLSRAGGKACVDNHAARPRRQRRAQPGPEARGRETPMSSFQSSGASAMNERIISTQSGSSSTTSSTPRACSSASLPRKVLCSPMTTLGMPYRRIAPVHMSQGDSVV